MEVPASEKKHGSLSVVSTPIGNPADITYKAINYLKECSFIICEEFKEAVKLLKLLGFEKELVSLNEHNEEQITRDIFYRIINGETAALISDCGTPGFADQGNLLINNCSAFNIKINFAHGANSVLASVVTSGFDISRFYFKGFLSPKSDIRKREQSKLASIDKPVVIMDTTYRLSSLLSDVNSLFPDRNIALSLNATMDNEKYLHGTPSVIIAHLSDLFSANKIKAEFVLILNTE